MEIPAGIQPAFKFVGDHTEANVKPRNLASDQRRCAKSTQGSLGGKGAPQLPPRGLPIKGRARRRIRRDLVAVSKIRQNGLQPPAGFSDDLRLERVALVMSVQLCFRYLDALSSWVCTRTRSVRVRITHDGAISSQGVHPHISSPGVSLQRIQ